MAMRTGRTRNHAYVALGFVTSRNLLVGQIELRQETL